MPATTPKTSNARIPKQSNKKSATTTANKSEESHAYQEERADTSTQFNHDDNNQIESEEDRKTKVYYELGSSSGVENKTQGLYEHFNQEDGTMVSVPLEPQLVITPEEIARRQSERSFVQQMFIEKIVSQQKMIESLEIQLKLANSTIGILSQQKTAQSNSNEK